MFVLAWTTTALPRNMTANMQAIFLDIYRTQTFDLVWFNTTQITKLRRRLKTLTKDITVEAQVPWDWIEFPEKAQKNPELLRKYGALWAFQCCTGYVDRSKNDMAGDQAKDSGDRLAAAMEGMQTSEDSKVPYYVTQEHFRTPLFQAVLKGIDPQLTNATPPQDKARKCQCLDVCWCSS
jgi:hypothetical protein